MCTTLKPVISSYLTPVSPSGTYNKVYTAKVYFTPIPNAVNVAIFFADPAKQYVQANAWCQGWVNGYWTYISCLPQGYLELSAWSFPMGVEQDLIFRATDAAGVRICEVPFKLTLPFSENYCAKLVIGAAVMDNPAYTKNQFIVEWYCGSASSYDIAVTSASGTTVTTVASVGFHILTGNYNTAYSIDVTARFADGRTLISDTANITTGVAPIAVKPTPVGKKK